MSLIVDIIRREPGVNVIIPDGRIDAETCDMFEKKVKEIVPQCTKAVIFDMSKLDYINSSGLGIIFYARKTIESIKGACIMTNLKPQIRKVFDIVKALPKESVFESIDEADRYLDEIQRREIEREK